MSELKALIAEKINEANNLALQAGEMEKQARSLRSQREQIKLDLQALNKQAQAEAVVEAEQQAATSAAQAAVAAETSLGETRSVLDAMTGLLAEIQAERKALAAAKAAPEE